MVGDRRQRESYDSYRDVTLLVFGVRSQRGVSWRSVGGDVV